MVHMSQQLSSRPVRRSPDPQLENAIRRLLFPGQCIYLAGSSGSSQAVLDTLQFYPDLTRGVTLLTSLIPGINQLDLSRLHPTAVVQGPFPILAPQGQVSANRAVSQPLPLTYRGFIRHIREKANIDLAVVQVSPPDAAGLCSLGPAAEFMPVVLQQAPKLLGVINPNLPRIDGAPSIALNRFDMVVEAPAALVPYQAGADATSTAVASRIAPLIDDGAVLQLGLGKVPEALAEQLVDRRNLRFHSGLLSDGFIRLWDAGAIRRDDPQVTCVAIGSAALYERLPDFSTLQIMGCEHTHDLTVLGATPKLTAINSALEVDLFGHCNLSVANGRKVSAAGGAPDFARGARLAQGGISIIALPATHAGGSRIVPCLTQGPITSVHRMDIDFVVTEHGVARLSGLGLHQQAEALIAIAAPDHQAGLTAAWREMSARL